MQVGVDVAVSGVAEADEPLAVRGGNGLEAAHGLQKRSARHGHVAADAVRAEHVGSRTDPAAVGPEAFFLLALAAHHPQGVVEPRREAGVFQRHRLPAAVHLKEQERAHRLRPRRIPGPGEDVEHRFVHELHGAGEDARGKDLAHGGQRRIKRGIARQHRGGTLRLGQELQIQLGDDAERAFAAHEKPGEVEPDDVLVRAAPQPEQPAAGERRLHAEHVVARHAVFHGPQAPGAGHHVAANGCRPAAGRIGRIEKPFFLTGLLEAEGIDARLDLGHEIVRRNIEDAVHAKHGHHHARLGGHAAPGKTRAPAPRVDGDAFGLGPAQQFEHLPRLAGPHHRQHRASFQAGVRSVDAQRLFFKCSVILE